MSKKGKLSLGNFLTEVMWATDTRLTNDRLKRDSFDSPMGCNLLVTQASGKPMTFCACSRRTRELQGKSTRDKGINNSRCGRENTKFEE